MRKILLFFLCGTMTQLLSGQESDDQNAYERPTVIPSVLVGTNMPFGDFYRPDYNISGYADAGNSAEIGLMFMARPSFGVSISFLYMNNPVNVDRMLTTLNRFGSYGGEYTYNIDTDTWRNNAFLMGIAYKLNNKRASFDINLKFGMLSTNTPDTKVSVYQNQGDSLVQEYYHRSERNASLAANAGMQFRFHIVQGVYVNLSSHFLISSLSIDQPLLPDGPNIYQYYSGGWYMNYGTFNILGGLSYEFELK